MGVGFLLIKWVDKMKKFFTYLSLIIIFLFSSMISVSAEINTDIKLNEQTILEKEYENKGITGMYGVEMFLPDDENIFKQQANKKDSNIDYLKSSLFFNNHDKTNQTVSEQVEEMNLFSKVKNYANKGVANNTDDISIYFISVFLICIPILFGFVGSKLLNNIKKKKEF